MPPTDDPKYAEFGDHGKRRYETLTQGRSLNERALEIVRELAQIADARSVLNNLSSTYQRKVYEGTKEFPEVVTMANLYEVERRENEAPRHRTVTGIRLLLGLADDTTVRQASKVAQEKETELVKTLENIVKL